MRILYIGNKLENSGDNPSGVITLGLKLSEFNETILISNKRNQVLRLIDMVLTMLRRINDYDIILIDAFSGRAYYYLIICSLIAIIIQKPYLPILRGGDLPNTLKKFKYFSKIVFKNSLLNITPSLFLKKHFNLHNISTKYIPNFIDLNNYPFKKRERCRPRLFWVRSFHKVYNPVFAVKVISELVKKYPNAELCMVGPDKDGSLATCKALIKKLNLTKNVKITGYLSKKDWINLSKNYDIFINTTNYDNQPVSVLEAMSLGFPIVTTDAGGLKYLHTNGVDALIVKKNDVKGMINKIEVLINNAKQSKNLSINARLKSEDFCWKKIKPIWEKVLISN